MWIAFQKKVMHIQPQYSMKTWNTENKMMLTKLQQGKQPSYTGVKTELAPYDPKITA